MKLTPTQKNILIRMDKGEGLRVNDQGDAWFMLDGDPKTIRRNTFKSLWGSGMIYFTELTSHDVSLYRITDKGHEAIQ